MEIRAAREDELGKVLDCILAAFPHANPERMKRHLYGDSSYQLHQSRICIVDGKVVSYVRVSNRPIRIGSATVKMGGVGAVGTRPDYRHNGYSTATLKDAVHYMEDEGYDMSMLFTGIQPFYKRLGWVCFPEHTFAIDLRCKDIHKENSHQRRGDNESCLVRDFDNDRDLKQIIEIYNDHNQERTGTLVRSKQYWYDQHSQFMGCLPSLVAERSGSVVAYVGISFSGEDAYIREAGYRSDSIYALPSLASAILRRAYDANCTRIRGLLPRNHPLPELLCNLSNNPMTHQISEGMMLRVINLKSLLGKLAPVFQRRLERSGLPNVNILLGFNVDGHKCNLKIEDGKVTVGDYGDSETQLSLTSRPFFKLLLGDSTIGQQMELLRVDGLSLNNRTINLIEAIFPKQEPIYWGCDHF